MAQVSVSIAGKSYRMGCDDGQEEHLAGLAAEVDTRIESMRKSFGEIGDMRLTIMTAVALTDQLGEQKALIAQLQKDVDSLKTASSDAEAERSGELLALAKSVVALAGRVDGIAESLLARDGEPE